MRIMLFSRDNLISSEIKKKMFDLLEMNMSKIAPIDKDRDEIFNEWEESLDKCILTGTRHILIMGQHQLRGYLSYSICYTNKDIFLNEIQIHSLFQIDGVTIRKLLSIFLNEIQEYRSWNIKTYVNHRNENSNKLALKIGFELEEITERGRRYILSVETILSKFSSILKR